MAVNFTDDQLRAIETLDKSILVSAAAGSGKTAVLVERIIRIILEGRANVDEMLVVTFTKAAASEMRVRLSSKIRDRMRDHSEERPRLREQLGRLYRAYISTIDSFALRVIREFFYETDIEPDFGTCDEIQGERLKRETVAELFEEGFENDGFLSSDPVRDFDITVDAKAAIDGIGFREFLRLYSEERSEEGFKEDLMKAYDRLRSMPDYFEWAYDKAENLRVSEENFASSELGNAVRTDVIETFRNVCDAMRRIRDLMYASEIGEMFEEKLLDEEAEISGILEELEAGRLDAELLDRISGMQFTALRSRKPWTENYNIIKGDIKILRDAYKAEINSFRSKYLTPDLQTRIRETNAAYGYTVYYIRLLEEFEKRYAAKKAEKRVMDFADMEHNAVRILGRDEAAEALRRRFKFIFVDEYQDTNNIQEYLISKVSRPDNVFRVGDVKQSIYKFRQAQPEIFEGLYKRFLNDEDGDGIVIDLSQNFRSNDATVRYINKVFETVMDGYDERARLYTGSRCDPAYDFVPEVHILTTDNLPEDEDAGGSEDPEAIDAEIEDLTKEEAEAAYIADLAAGLIGTEFHDTKTGEIRRATARDIVILFRAVKVRGDIVGRALRRRGIEPHVEEDDDYFDTVEVSVALSLLTCIDNMKRDVPLISTLHSEVFGWSPEELARVRIAHSEHLAEAEAARKQEALLNADPDDGREDADKKKFRPRPAYWEALEWYTAEGPEGELRDKAVYARNKIFEWRRLSGMMSLEDFVWKVLVDSGYYMMAGAMNGGARRQANLRVLVDRAAKYSSETVSSLSSYITFLDVMRSKKIKNGQARTTGSDDDVIRISTIHKSKGLEYPFVIVGGLGHKFKEGRNEKKLAFDPAIGVSLPYIDPARKYWRSTLIQRAINSKSQSDSYREELRVLYVAMTRARNKLIMVGTEKSEENVLKYTAHPSNFLRVMRDVIRTPYNRYHIGPLEMQARVKDADRGSLTAEIPESLTPEAEDIYREVDRRFGYRYPYEELLTAKAKYSVSEIRREELARDPSDISGNKAVSGLDHNYGLMANSAARIENDEDPGNSAVHKLDDEVVRLSENAERRKHASAADVGIAYHRIMEYLDFARCIGQDGGVSEDYIREQAERLVEMQAVDRDAYNGVRLSNIYGFFGQEIGRRAARAASAGSLRKEKAFTLKTTRDGRDILVQGVIDCCFPEDGKMVLVDYKSSYIRRGADHDAELERIRQEYRVQLELYAEAIAKGTGLETGEAYLYLFNTGELVAL